MLSRMMASAMLVQCLAKGCSPVSTTQFFFENNIIKTEKTAITSEFDCLNIIATDVVHFSNEHITKHGYMFLLGIR